MIRTHRFIPSPVRRDSCCYLTRECADIFAHCGLPAAQHDSAAMDAQETERRAAVEHVGRRP